MNIPLVDLHAQYIPLKDEIFAGMETVFEGMQLFLGKTCRRWKRISQHIAALNLA